MANGIRTGDLRGLNKGRSSKFREGSRVRQTPEEGRRTYRPKRCGNNNKDEDNSPKTLLIIIIKLRLRNLDNRILLFLVEHCAIRKAIIRYYLLQIDTTLILSRQKYEYAAT